MTTTRANPAATREAGIAHVSSKLAAPGWIVAREGKAKRLIIDKGRIRSPVQGRSVGAASAAGLGKGIGLDAALWWAITTNASGAIPVSYILTRDEVQSLQHIERDGSAWPEIRDYTQPVFRGLWSRISPLSPATPKE